MRHGPDEYQDAELLERYPMRSFKLESINLTGQRRPLPCQDTPRAEHIRDAKRRLI